MHNLNLHKKNYQIKRLTPTIIPRETKNLKIHREQLTKRKTPRNRPVTKQKLRTRVILQFKQYRVNQNRKIKLNIKSNPLCRTKNKSKFLEHSNLLKKKRRLKCLTILLLIPKNQTSNYAKEPNVLDVYENKRKYNKPKKKNSSTVKKPHNDQKKKPHVNQKCEKHNQDKQQNDENNHE